jgi:hypothetical protein
VRSLHAKPLAALVRQATPIVAKLCGKRRATVRFPVAAVVVLPRATHLIVDSLGALQRSEIALYRRESLSERTRTSDSARPAARTVLQTTDARAVGAHETT